MCTGFKNKLLRIIPFTIPSVELRKIAFSFIITPGESSDKDSTVLLKIYCISIISLSGSLEYEI